LKRRPDTFIVGAPRCGTTALFEFLGQHPEIFGSPAKEIHYFGSDLHHAGRAPLSEADYLRNFADAGDELRIAEASTSYFYSERAPAEIEAFNREARVIIMLRNPVDLMYSLYNLYRSTGVEPHDTFEAALAAEPSRRAGHDLPDRPVLVEGLFYRRVAALAEHTHRFLTTFGSERMHVIVFDDFVDDLPSVYAGTLRFLDVDESFVPDFRVHNAATQPRSRRLQALVLSPPRPVARPLRALVPQRTRGALSHAIRRANAVARPVAPLDPDLRQRLQQELAEEVEQLGSLLGRDLSHWSKS
jgi:hypothetical protein